MTSLRCCRYLMRVPPMQMAASSSWAQQMRIVSFDIREKGGAELYKCCIKYLKRSPLFLPMEFTFLGTGTSTGVPRIGCPCAVCATSKRGMKNHRLRCSALIRHEGRTILIDTGPDFREQMLTHKVDRI